MQFFVVVALLLAVCATNVFSASSCDSQKNEKNCMAGSEAGEKCSWCSSAAVGSTCFKESDAKSLPSSIYSCEYQKVMSGATTCDSLKNEKNCMAGSEAGEKCSWCSSAAVGSTCFKESDAKSLPSSIYACEYQKVMSGATACDEFKSEKSCITGSASGSKCSWCKSAAVGATCFAESDAKSLPSSIYECEYQKMTSGTSSCDEFKSEKSCMGGSASGSKCSWCKSAAVGATCFAEADAKSLPSSIYECEYQKTYLRQ